MPNIHSIGTPISASTSSARAAIPAASSGNYIRVVNGTTSIAYVNAGDVTVTATSANFPVEPYGAVNLQRNPNEDTYVAVLLSASTGIVSFTVGGDV